MQPDENARTYHPIIVALRSVLRKYPGKWVIIGGIAASLLGKPRLTADVDVLIFLSPQEIPGFINNAKDARIYPRMEDAEVFARENQVLLMVHDNSKINIDFILGMLPFEEEVLRRAVGYAIDDLQLNLPTVEDLIIMKAIGQRPKDIMDIQELVNTNTHLDMEHIEYWLRDFGVGMHDAHLWERTREIITQA